MSLARWRNDAERPRYSVDDLPRYVQRSYNIRSDSSRSNEEAFFNDIITLGHTGARYDLSARNTWETAVDISGSGKLFHVISPASTFDGSSGFSGAPGDPEYATVGVRITLDGSVYTFEESVATGSSYGDRLIIGSFLPTGAAGNETMIQMPVVNAGLVNPPFVLFNNAPHVLFKSGLKVEVKGPGLNTINAGRVAGVCYVLDGTNWLYH